MCATGLSDKGSAGFSTQDGAKRPFFCGIFINVGASWLWQGSARLGAVLCGVAGQGGARHVAVREEGAERPLVHAMLASQNPSQP